jgi:hypothetical protein
MKKLLLTLAAGMLILALPVIASAQITFTEYSGHAAKISLTGFARYSTAAGVTYGHVGGSRWAQTAKTTTAKNVIGRFDWDSDGYFEMEMQLNDNTWMEIEGENPVKTAKKSNTIISNVEFEIWETGNGATITSTDGWIFNYSGDGSVLQLDGAAVAYIVRDPRQGTLVISLKKPTVSWAGYATVTSGLVGSWNWNPGLAFTQITIPPIKLIPTGNTGTWGP